jgi:hypothetical protein
VEVTQVIQVTLRQMLREIVVIAEPVTVIAATAINSIN